jgi:hypothetical protein
LNGAIKERLDLRTLEPIEVDIFSGFECEESLEAWIVISSRIFYQALAVRTLHRVACGSLAEEHGLAVVAALNNVERLIGQKEPADARHGFVLQMGT